MIGQVVASKRSQANLHVSGERIVATLATATECDERHRKRERKLHRVAMNLSSPNEVPPIVQRVMCLPGQQLDEQIRVFIEPRFGYKFSAVRGHLNKDLPMPVNKNAK